MYQKTVEYFKLLQESATTFADNLKDGALQEQIAFEEGIEEFSKMVEEIQDPVEKDLGERKLILLGIKEDMINYLDLSREFMETHITRNEKDIQKRVKDDIESNLNNIASNQHTRNRNIVKEIIDTCHSFRNEITDYFGKMREEYEDA